MSSTRVVRHIRATRSAIYRALLDPQAVQAWRVPDGMTAAVNAFSATEGGRFRVTLTYQDPGVEGKSAAHSDSYHGYFAQLVPDAQIVEVVEFETPDPSFAGEMTITTSLADTDDGTEVTVAFEGLPAGVAVADNDLGTMMALDKLAGLVESDTPV